MSKIRIILTLLAGIFLICHLVSAQQNERQINLYKWENEPLAILAIKIKDKKINPQEMFVDADEDWFRSLTVEVENISQKTIASIQIAIDFPEIPERKDSSLRGWLWYSSYDLSKPHPSQPPLAPKAKATLKINYPILRELLDKLVHPKNIKEFQLSIGFVFFADNVMWSVGAMFIPDPDNPRQWIREKLPNP